MDLALATPTLSPVAVFTGSPFLGFPSRTVETVAVNASGDAIVGLSESFGTSREPQIRERVGGQRGIWRTTRALGLPAASNVTTATAVNRTGDGLVVFAETGGGLDAMRRSRGIGSPITHIGASRTAGATFLAAALADDGRAVAVLGTPSGTGGTAAVTINVFTQRTDADFWERAGTITTPVVARDDIDISVSRRGDVLVGWATSGPAATATFARLLAGDPAFESPQTISGTGATHPGVAIADNGDAVAVWMEPTTTGTAGKFASRASGAATWTAGPDVAASTGIMFLTPSRDSLGNTLVAIDDGPGVLPRTASAAFLPAGDAVWQRSPVLLREGTGSLDGVFPVLEQGRARIIIDDHPGPGDNSFTLTIRNRTTGAWTALQDISPDGDGMPFGAAPNGDLLFYRDGIVRNFDSAVTPTRPTLSGVSVRVRRPNVTLRLTLNTRALLWMRIRSLSRPHESAVHPKRFVAKGPHTVELGEMKPGRYSLQLAPCNSRAGCNFGGLNRPIIFRVR